MKKLDMKRSMTSWPKMRDQRHTLIQYLIHEKHFGTGDDKTIEKKRGSATLCGRPAPNRFMPGYEDRSPILDQGHQRVVTVIDGTAVTFAFPDAKREPTGGRCCT